MTQIFVTTAKRRLLFTAAVLSVALAVLMSVMYAESGEAPLSAAVEMTARGGMAIVLAALLRTRRRWSGIPLAILDLSLARWFIFSFAYPVLSSFGRSMMMSGLVLEVGCAAVLVWVPLSATSIGTRRDREPEAA